MSTYHHVVLKSVRTGEWIARINPADWGFSIKQGPGGSFDLEKLPAVLVRASSRYGPVDHVWVNDEVDPDFDEKWPWEGPRDLYLSPDLSYFTPHGD